MSETVYLNGSYVPKEEARVSVEDRGYQFADGVYEVVFVWGGRFAFMDRHMDRLRRSAEAIRIPIPGGTPSICRVADELLLRDGREVASLYLQITRGVAPRDHQFPKESQPTVVMYLKSAPEPGPLLHAGIDAITLPDERWLRCDIKSVSLLPNILARQRAVDAGVREAVLVRDGTATECASSNLFMVKGGALWTHPLTRLILPGITRGVVLEEAQGLGIPTREEPFGVEELFTAEEIFETSTTSHVQPIARLNGIQVGSGAWPVTRRIQEAYFLRLEAETGRPVRLNV